LAAWDFSTPTGIDEGWDPGDATGIPGPAGAAEIDASVAATIYSTWRGQVIQRVIDQTLANQPIPLNGFTPGTAQAMSAFRHLMFRYPVTGGTGASLINFFNVPGVPDQFVAKDVILLGCLQDALDLLASDEMAAAFGNSADLDDYRWGKLHRIVFAHTLGGPFSVPGAGSPENLAPDLPGYSRAGGMGALDASSHSARADGINKFMFGAGPARRFIATMTPDGPEAMQVIPGGESGVLGSPNRTDQLQLWLANEYHPLPVSLDDVNAQAVATEDYECGDGVTGPGEQCDDGNTNDNDGCNQACRITPIITCSSPTVSADDNTCTAEIACDVIASCIDPAGGSTTLGCTPDGPYGLGATDVTVQCGDSEDTTIAVCQAVVADTTPPTISVTTSPDDLWPPNHRMVDIETTVIVTDSCGPATFVLESVTSSEPDNAAGNGDGNTDQDVQGDDTGTEDYFFQVRAERASDGEGRSYTATYTATDSSGNQASASGTITVAHDRGGRTDPLELILGKNVNGTLVAWNDYDNSGGPYNLIRGTYSQLKELGTEIDLGIVSCLEAATTELNTSGNEDAELPPSGELFFYLIETDTGIRSSYGTESTPKPRNVKFGDCR
jgi:cysteine-rich repeat protein